jgi:hypothetical protein
MTTTVLERTVSSTRTLKHPASNNQYSNHKVVLYKNKQSAAELLLSYYKNIKPIKGPLPSDMYFERDDEYAKLL